MFSPSNLLLFTPYYLAALVTSEFLLVPLTKNLFSYLLQNCIYPKDKASIKWGSLCAGHFLNVLTYFLEIPFCSASKALNEICFLYLSRILNSYLCERFVRGLFLQFKSINFMFSKF